MRTVSPCTAVGDDSRTFGKDMRLEESTGTSAAPAAKASMGTKVSSAGSEAGSSKDINGAIEPEAIERTSKARIGHNPRASSQAGGVALSGQGPEALSVTERRQCRMPDAPSENILARRKAMMDSTFATAAEEERLRWRRSLWSFLATAPSMDLVGTWLLENVETLNTPFGRFFGLLADAALPVSVSETKGVGKDLLPISIRAIWECTEFKTMLPWELHWAQYIVHVLNLYFCTGWRHPGNLQHCSTLSRQQIAAVHHVVKGVKRLLRISTTAPPPDILVEK